MKHFLRLLALVILSASSSIAQAQVTQLSNNTNIRGGIALGSIGVLADKNGALWRTDGTAAGTFKYTSKVIIDTTLNTAVLNNKIYFNGYTAGSGKELWVTDGTDAGTQLVKDINSGSTNSSPSGLIVFNNALYFFASTTAGGVELWKSDGTNTGTAMVKDIDPGAGSSYDDSYTSLFASGSALYFDANDGTHGTELWKTNGTEAGTVMIKDINTGADPSNCENFIMAGNTLLFSATDATHGTELWKTDGTEAGTVIVQDLVSGSGSSSPQQLVPFNDKVVFLTLTGSPIPTYKLYLTDGNSITLVKDFGDLAIAVIANSVTINSKLYFMASSLTTGIELWSSDGTAAGTALFKDINPGLGNSVPIILPDYLSLINGSTDIHTKLFNGKIFFAADDGTHGRELWITDGTAANTKMVKDLYPGADSSLSLEAPSWFYTANSFYYAANNGTAGIELFKTDGTEANTGLVQDINPGSGSSNPFLFMALNNHLYFTADNGDNANGDNDLYKVDEDVVLPVSLLDFSATLNGKAVDVKWSTAAETNTKNFVVQRSIDAVHFNNIGTAEAAGNSTIKKDYNFIDAGAFNAGAKVIYYRLQMADNDGKSANSKIVRVEMAANNSAIAVYPNPVKDKLMFVTNSSSNNAIIKVTDESGKIVLVKKLQTIQAGEKNIINVAGLGNGVYYIQFISGNDKQMTRFIKY